MSNSKPNHKYYPEEVLIDLVQRGVFSWVDYVLHYSEEWREDFGLLSSARHDDERPQCLGLHSIS